MLEHTEEDLDNIGDTAFKLLTYLEISQVYLSYFDSTEYSALNLLDLIDDMIKMTRSITDKF